MQKIIEKILKLLARAVLKKQRPQIVSITGSMGKTSTKEAIYFVLKKKFKARQSIKNYNNELGVPLTILNEVSPGKSFIGWLTIFYKGIVLAFFKKKDYPQVLILETAADKPGDLKYLMNILLPELLKVAVLTGIAPVHLEFFKTMENIFEEKITPFFHLKKENFAVINKDNCDFKKMKPRLNSKIITYGIEKEADLMAEEIKITEQGLSFNFRQGNNSHPFLLKQAISSHQLYSLLAAASVGIYYGMGLKEICEQLKKYKVLAGRMRKIKGINNSFIIDDTYNSSPEAVKKSLKALSRFPFGKRKIAVLGAMLELGESTNDFHCQIGELVADLKIDYLITLGTKGKIIYQGALEKTLHREQLFHFDNLEKLSSFLKDFITQDDIILVKGSQKARMEKIVRQIMLEPENAKQLLVRQDKQWQDK